MNVYQLNKIDTALYVANEGCVGIFDTPELAKKVAERYIKGEVQWREFFEFDGSTGWETTSRTCIYRVKVCEVISEASLYALEKENQEYIDRLQKRRDQAKQGLL